VEDAQCSKGETQKLADTISGYFVPVVVFLSLMTFLIWDILGGVGIVCSFYLVLFICVYLCDTIH
jgi:cation transport ATPase